MRKLFKKSNALTSLPLPTPLTALNLWIIPYISTLAILFLTRLQSHWTVFSSWMLHWTYYTIFQHHNLIWEHLQNIWNTFFSPFSTWLQASHIRHSSTVSVTYCWANHQQNFCFGECQYEQKRSQTIIINRILNYRLTYG